MSSPLRRNIKVSQKKLPEDFFAYKCIEVNPNFKQIYRSQLQTQDQQRNIPSIQRISETRELSGRK
jgi:hypothetical protein